MLHQLLGKQGANKYFSVFFEKNLFYVNKRSKHITPLKEDPIKMGPLLKLFVRKAQKEIELYKGDTKVRLRWEELKRKNDMDKVGLIDAERHFSKSSRLVLPNVHRFHKGVRRLATSLTKFFDAPVTADVVHVEGLTTMMVPHYDRRHTFFIQLSGESNMLLCLPEMADRNQFTRTKSYFQDYDDDEDDNDPVVEVSQGWVKERLQDNDGDACRKLDATKGDVLYMPPGMVMMGGTTEKKKKSMYLKITFDYSNFTYHNMLYNALGSLPEKHKTAEIVEPLQDSLVEMERVLRRELRKKGKKVLEWQMIEGEPRNNITIMELATVFRYALPPWTQLYSDKERRYLPINESTIINNYFGSAFPDMVALLIRYCRHVNLCHTPKEIPDQREYLEHFMKLSNVLASYTLRNFIKTRKETDKMIAKFDEPGFKTATQCLSEFWFNIVEPEEPKEGEGQMATEDEDIIEAEDEPIDVDELIDSDEI